MIATTGKRRRFALLASLLGVGMGLLVAEAALRIAGYQPGRANAGYLRFGYTTGIPTFDEDGVRSEQERAPVRLFGPDPDLFWAPLPSTEFTNSQGLRATREVPVERAPGSLRVLFIADSCAFLGDPVYPEVVERLLAARDPALTAEAVNASVPGYTSFQGLKLLDRLERFRPDAVCIAFGWNDHWRAQGGLTDREQWALGHGSRLLGLVRAAIAGRRREAVHRVPIAEFEENLEAIRRKVEGWGATPVFVTTPQAFVTGRMPAWAQRFFGESYHMDRAMVEAIPATHTAYAEAVRRVAARGKARLVDAARDFPTDEEATRVLFRADRIHLRTAGHERLGKLIADALGARERGD